MRSFNYSFREGLTKGLRQYATHMRNIQGLVECHNALPMEEGLTAYTPITNLTITGGGGTWVATSDSIWPQVKFLERFTLGFAMVGSDLGWFELTYVSGTTWTASLIQTIGIIPIQIEVASSGTFYVIAFYDGSNNYSYLRYPDGVVGGL